MTTAKTLDWIGVAAIPVSLAMAAVCDAAQLPWAELGNAFSVSAALLQTCAVLTVELALQQPLLVALQLIAGLVFALRQRVPLRVQRVVTLATTLLMAGSLYATLVVYERFAGYLPFVAATFGLACVWFVALQPLGGKPVWASRIRLAASLTSFAVALAAGYAHSRFYQGYYPTLHRTLIGIIAVSTYAGSVGAIAQLLPQAPHNTRGRRVFGAAACVVTAAALLVPLVMPPPVALLPYVRSFASLGQAQDAAMVGRPALGGARELDCAELAAPMDPGAAEATFRAHAGLPSLPPDFDLRRYNVLVVTTEAVRFDQTSLANPKLDTTPTLKMLEQRGAFVFTEARAPATSTLQTMASVMAMRLPIDTPLVFGSTNWRGRLPAQVGTAAEAATLDGYNTFHVLHGGIKHCCGESLSQGFAVRHFEGSDVMKHHPEGLEQQRDVDRLISDRAIDLLGAVKAEERFFAWLFYFSPHSQYLARKPGTWPPFDRYRQEIRNADEQLGRVVEQLDQSGRLDSTVVVIMADHGEQFGEHGGDAHGNSVYAELKRVPLVVWIPGMRGSQIEVPTSTAYVLPWLLAHGPQAMRRAALAGITDSIAPAMHLTDGGVPVNLLYQRGALGRLALDYPGASIHLEYRSGLIQMFDLRHDPGEKENVFEREHPELERLAKHLQRYAALAVCRRQPR